jgi:hypothetical protein
MRESRSERLLGSCKRTRRPTAECDRPPAKARVIAMPRIQSSRLRNALTIQFVAKEWRAGPRRRPLLFAHCDHPDGRARTIAPGSEGPADAVEKQWCGGCRRDHRPRLCIAGSKQSSVSRGKATEAVALRKPGAFRAYRLEVCFARERSVGSCVGRYRPPRSESFTWTHGGEPSCFKSDGCFV